MYLVEFIIILAASMITIAWLERLPNYYSLFAIGPFLIIVMLVIWVNTDAVLSHPISTLDCHYYEANSTWVNNCQWYSYDEEYPLSPQMLLMLNIGMMITTIIFSYYTFEKMVDKKARK